MADYVKLRPIDAFAAQRAIAVRQIQPTYVEPAGLEIAYASVAVSSTNTDVYTFSSQGIGTASADRNIVVVVSSRATGGPSITSLTVGGTACTAGKKQIASSGDSFVAIYITSSPITTGTTADIVVTFNGTNENCGIGVYAVTGALNSTTPTATNGTTTDNSAMSVTINAGGVGIAVGGYFSNQTTFTTSGTGWAEDFDEVVEASSSAFTGASSNTAGSNSVTIDGANNGTYAFAVAAYR